MKIAVAGTGYVGLSIATLLAQQNDVVAVDIVQDRVDMVNRRESPIQDEYIERFFKEDNLLQSGKYSQDFIIKEKLNLRATTKWEDGYADADFVVVAAPTNYDSERNFFDTSAVEDVIQKVLQVNTRAVIVIKSTIPVGYTESVRDMFTNAGKKPKIMFAPEFLRESKALYDNLYPSRIIVGFDQGDTCLSSASHTFATLIKNGAIKQDVPILYMGSTEAEAVKLFANTYLAHWIHTLSSNFSILNR